MAKMTVPALSDYGNAWTVAFSYLGDCVDYLKEGDAERLENCLDNVRREAILKPDDYQKKYDTAFEPDFTESQKHRMNYLAETYNSLREEENPDVEAMYRLAQIPIKLIRKWANPASSR